jgi:hypothetical protein
MRILRGSLQEAWQGIAMALFVKASQFPGLKHADEPDDGACGDDWGNGSRCSAT